MTNIILLFLDQLDPFWINRIKVKRTLSIRCIVLWNRVHKSSFLKSHPFICAFSELRNIIKNNNTMTVLTTYSFSIFCRIIDTFTKYPIPTKYPAKSRSIISTPSKSDVGSRAGPRRRVTWSRQRDMATDALPPLTSTDISSHAVERVERLLKKGESAGKRAGKRTGARLR